MLPDKSLSSEDRERYIAEYARTGLKMKSASNIGVDYGAIKNLAEMDEEFQQNIIAAYNTYRENLEREAHARAVEGWEEPVYYQGTQIGTIRRKSDRMLELMLKRHIPEFRDHQKVDMNVTGGVLAVPGLQKDSRAWEEQAGNSPPPES